ncbi:hypothetical protein MMC19_001518 [Ptychographa xylographoides]|nr:hypothetical protein [Ptychographa xylographoides]
MPMYICSSQFKSPRSRSPPHPTSLTPKEAIQGQIVLSGLSSDYKSPLILYMPTVHFFPSPDTEHSRSDCSLDSLGSPPAVDQLENSITWKGLSIETATILYEMDRVIAPCLQDLLASNLEELDAIARTDCLRFESSIFGQQDVCHPLKFRLSRLIDRMLLEMQFSSYHDIAPQPHEVLLELVLLYLISRNSIDGIGAIDSADAIVYIGLQPGRDLHSEIVPPSVAHVIPRLDFLTFPELDVRPREGTVIKIVPKYCRGVSAKTNDCDLQVSYSIGSLPNWLQWDDVLRGWKGQIPLYSQGQDKSGCIGDVISGGRDGPDAIVNLLRLEVKAVSITSHPSLSVYLTRTVRTRLTLKVIPWYAPKDPQSATSSLYLHGHPQLEDSHILIHEPYKIPTESWLHYRNDVLPTLESEFDDRDLSFSGPPDKFSRTKKPEIPVCHVSDTAFSCRTTKCASSHVDILQGRNAPTSTKPMQQSEARNYRGSNDLSIVSDPSYSYCSGPEIAGKWPQTVAARPISSHGLPGGTTRHTLQDPYTKYSNQNRQLVSRDYSQVIGSRKRHYYGDNRGGYHQNNQHRWQDREESSNEYCLKVHDQNEERNNLHDASSDMFIMVQNHPRTRETYSPSPVQMAHDENLSPIQLWAVPEQSAAGSAILMNEEPLTTRDLDMVSSEPQQEQSLLVSLNSARGMARVTCDTNQYSLHKELKEENPCFRNRPSSTVCSTEVTDIDHTSSSSIETEQETLVPHFGTTTTTQPRRKIDSGSYMADDELESNDAEITYDSMAQDNYDPQDRHTGPLNNYMADHNRLWDTFGLQFALSGVQDRAAKHNVWFEKRELLQPNHTRSNRRSTNCRRYVSTSPMYATEQVSDAHPGTFGANSRSLKSLGSPTRIVDEKKKVINTLGNQELETRELDLHIRKEQVMLWNLLKIEGEGHQRRYRDLKLEAEEKKGLWEVLKWEAAQRTRGGFSEDTLGIESMAEEEILLGSDDTDEEITHCSGSREDMEDTWNFGC